MLGIDLASPTIVWVLVTVLKGTLLLVGVVCRARFRDGVVLSRVVLPAGGARRGYSACYSPHKANTEARAIRFRRT